MRRRDFIRAISGAVAAWPIAARAQQPERVRRIGVLMPGVADDPELKARIAAFQQALREFGWTDGRNMRFDYRWAAGNPDRIHSYAAELVALAPDVILATASAATAALLQASFEYGIAGKWLELLKQIAPAVTRAAVIRDPNISSGIGQWAVIQAMAPSMGVELSLINMRDAGAIERDITAVARSSNGGLIVTATPLATQHRELIIRLAGDHKLPAIYFERYFVSGGGLISYGPYMVDQYRQAAGYVDRILKGEKPADLPVQAPTKYELVVNLKTAKALGISAPSTLLARADEVIE